MAGRSDPVALLRGAWPVLGLAIPLAIIVLLSGAFSVVFERIVTEALIKLVAVIGLYIFIGNSGALSLGHVAFMGIAAYASAWQTCCPGLKPITMSGLPQFLQTTTVPNVPALLLSATAAMMVAAIVGTVLMRLERVAIAIATMASLFIFSVIYSNWGSVTQGTGSIVGLPMYLDPFVAYFWAVTAMIIAFAYQNSRWGKAMRAAREDEVAASSVGINVYLQRLIAFTLSAFVAGIAGVLFGHYLGTIKVATFSLNITFITLAMLIVGGRNSLAGAVVGVVVVTAVVESMRRLEVGFTLFDREISAPAGIEGIVLGLVMILILRFRPDGIMRGRELLWPRRRPGRKTTVASKEQSLGTG